MGQSAQTSQPVTEAADLVTLDPDHPGFRDEVYRARRNDIARLAQGLTPGSHIPCIHYTEEEHRVWATVRQRLEAVHRRHACAAYLKGLDRLRLDPYRIPQLSEVNQRLQVLTGFRMWPVAGLVTSKTFLAQLGQSVFLSTQYIRHASRPLYTPEPDLIHEVLGHAVSLCSPELAALNRLFGQVAAYVPESRMQELDRLYWYTSEFGVVVEEGRPKAYGAGLLSSCGELSRFASDAFLSPFDPEAATARPYDPTDYQKQLFFVPSLKALLDQLRRHLKQRFGGAPIVP